MTPSERYISFFNNYFIFKKIRTVDAEKIKLAATDESTAEIKLNLADTEAARTSSKKKKKKFVINE